MCRPNDKTKNIVKQNSNSTIPIVLKCYQNLFLIKYRIWFRFSKIYCLTFKIFRKKQRYEKYTSNRSDVFGKTRWTLIHFSFKIFNTQLLFPQICRIDFVSREHDVGRGRLLLSLPQLLEGLQGRVRARHVPHHALLHHLLHALFSLHFA